MSGKKDSEGGMKGEGDGRRGFLKRVAGAFLAITGLGGLSAGAGGDPLKDFTDDVGSRISRDSRTGALWYCYPTGYHSCAPEFFCTGGDHGDVTCGDGFEFKCGQIQGGVAPVFKCGPSWNDTEFTCLTRFDCDDFWCNSRKGGPWFDCTGTFICELWSTFYTPPPP